MTGTQVVVTAIAVLSVATLAWFFFGPKKARRAEVRGGFQQVEITVKGGYSPDHIRVQEGVPLRLVFDRQESGECSSRVVFPDFGVNRALPAYAQTTVELLPDRAGEYGFACGMNMLHGTLVVEPSEGAGSDRPPATLVPSVEPSSPPEHTTHEWERAVSVSPETEAGGTARVEFSLRGTGATCATCVWNIEQTLEGAPGVQRVEASVAAERIVAEFDPSRVTKQELSDAVTAIGYRVDERTESGPREMQDAEAAERRAEIADLTRRMVVGAVLTAPVLFATMLDNLHASWMPSLLSNHWFQLVLITPVMLYTGWPIHRTGWLTLRHRTADMNTLITIGSTAAFAYSLAVTVAPQLFPTDLRSVYYEAVGVILTLIILGRLFEARAKAGTGEAIRALIGLQAKTARILRDELEREVPVEDVQVGDLVLVRPSRSRSAPETRSSARRSTRRGRSGSGRRGSGGRRCSPRSSSWWSRRRRPRRRFSGWPTWWPPGSCRP